MQFYGDLAVPFEPHSWTALGSFHPVLDLENTRLGEERGIVRRNQ